MADHDSEDIRPSSLPPLPPPLPPMNTPSEAHDEESDRQLKVKMDLSCVIGSKRYQKEMQFRMVGAIEKQDLGKIRHLIKSGVNIDCVILYAKTPLIHALEQGYDDVAELLVDAGANLEKSETIAWQRRPLHMAVLKNSLRMVEALLRSGAQVDGQDGCGMTPLHHACHLGFRAIVDVLIHYGASMNLGDYVERDALHRAIEGKHLDIAELLLNYGISLSGADRYGWTPLFACVMGNDLEGTRFLLHRGADVNYKDHKGDTPLHVACDRLSRSNIRTMLCTSVDFYRRMRRIPTSDIQQLLQGENKAHFEMIDLLVNTGADINAVNDFQTRPVHMTRDPVVLKYLILCGAHIDYDMVLLTHLFGGEADCPSWLEAEFAMQTTLQRICRRVIRCHLHHTRNISEAVKCLPLPRKFIDYLNIVEFEHRV
ncbi:serine/threonine-protein phosphatase 6 regulatory ankyrin repeat subunit C-like isoform X1 [Haliotis cracherodii]|uniref:serine/threonine-protein phosphatase 6 regulatory ankyrin repeat subunit C-like isoform X1 n=2 Tax=Haliotis cracherodii TaxID=6455 RepID=UPI0039EBBC33